MKLHDKTDKIDVDRRVRLGDNMSPKLYTLVLKDASKLVDFNDRDINILGERHHTA